MQLPDAVVRPLGESTVTEALLETVLRVLEQRPDLALRLRTLLGAASQQSVEQSVVPHMTVAEYARYRRLSERTIRYQLAMMQEGLHFVRAGRGGRRTIIQVSHADRWQAEFGGRRVSSNNIEQVVCDEVTRRRAKAALAKQRKSK